MKDVQLKSRFSDTPSPAGPGLSVSLHSILFRWTSRPAFWFPMEWESPHACICPTPVKSYSVRWGSLDSSGSLGWDVMMYQTPINLTLLWMMYNWEYPVPDTAYQRMMYKSSSTGTAYLVEHNDKWWQKKRRMTRRMIEEEGRGRL